MRSLAGFLFALLLLASPLLEISRPGGLLFKHENSPTPQKYLLEAMGGGVALLDYNNDGLLDVFFVNSGYLRAPMTEGESFRRNEPKYWNRLYRQNKDHSFTDVTLAAGLAQAGNFNYGMGVAAADYDNDGFTDLYVTSYGRNVLYHNNRNGTFTDVTTQAGVAGGGWSASAGFFDFDNDGHLDLFVTRYMKWGFATSRVCPRDTYCPPGGFPSTTSLLYRNRGDGTFENVSEKSGIAAKQGRALGVAFNDYDGDGSTDIFVANDGMEQFLFHNERNGTFTERAMDAGVALSDDGKPYSGMGVDFRDYDNDGKADLIVTNLARQVYALYHNEGDGTFSYVSQASGLSVLSSGSSGWGVRWVDFSNEGWKDLFVAQSHVMDNIEQVDPTLRYRELALLAKNTAGHFERTAIAGEMAAAGRGAAFGDLINDGSTAVVMTTLGGQAVVFRSPANRNHWLNLRLRGTRSNRDAFGARVQVTAGSTSQIEYVNSAGSYLSSSDKRVHFGLGTSSTATVTVTWPSGKIQRLPDVQANQFLSIAEPE